VATRRRAAASAGSLLCTHGDMAVVHAGFLRRREYDWRAWCCSTCKCLCVPRLLVVGCGFYFGVGACQIALWLAVTIKTQRTAPSFSNHQLLSGGSGSDEPSNLSHDTPNCWPFAALAPSVHHPPHERVATVRSASRPSLAPPAPLAHSTLLVRAAFPGIGASPAQSFLF
jgi:hypothetical protein